MIVYFDTSALIAIYVRGGATRRALAARKAADHVATSLLAYAETLAVLARLERTGALTSSQRNLAQSRFLAEWASFQRIRVDSRLLPDVRRLLGQHPLKGADAVHLASACLVSQSCTNAGLDARFACDDRTLARAAAGEGLSLAM